MIINKNSLEIILDLYKEDKVTKEQAVQLIQDIHQKEVYTYPYFPQIWYNNNPTQSPENPNFPEYKVTCSTTKER